MTILVYVGLRESVPNSYGALVTIARKSVCAQLFELSSLDPVETYVPILELLGQVDVSRWQLIGRDYSESSAESLVSLPCRM